VIKVDLPALLEERVSEESVERQMQVVDAQHFPALGRRHEVVLL
jgi:hypothetical protein